MARKSGCNTRGSVLAIACPFGRGGVNFAFCRGIRVDDKSLIFNFDWIEELR